MRKTGKHSNLLGVKAEAQFIVYAFEGGWEVSSPFLKSASYDFVIRRSPEVPWETVQVKRAYYTTSGKRRILEVGFRRRIGNKNGLQPYKDGDFDWLFSFHEDGRWFMPWDLVKGMRSSVKVGSSRYDLWKV